MKNIDQTHSEMVAARALDVVHGFASSLNDDGTCNVNGKKVVNFGNCSYLGLETHPNVKLAAVRAIRDFGVQFSSSKAYLSCELYNELEIELSKVLNVKRVVVASTTTLTHAAAIPIVVNDGDAVIIDPLVHSSVQMNLPELLTRGVTIKRSRHNDLQHVSEIASDLAKTHNKVVYMCDGVYSMHGNVLNVNMLESVLDQNKKLFAYVDDAHGMSWTGKRGAGTVMGTRDKLHERIVLVFGLAKGFGCAGGVITTPDGDLLDKIATCGRTIVFSGPVPPPMLGAAIESAKMHSSNEIEPLQKKVIELVETFNDLVINSKLKDRLACNETTPIRFIEIGSIEDTVNITSKLLNDGFFVNVGAYPAVAQGRAGLRIVLNAKMNNKQVSDLVEQLESYFK